MKGELLTPLAVVAGIVLLAASFVWPHIARRAPGAWTEEKALRHAQTRAELHAASHALFHPHRQAGGQAPGASELARARALQERFEAELAELDAARNRGEGVGRFLWWTGTTLIVLAGAVHLLRRAA